MEKNFIKRDSEILETIGVNSKIICYNMAADRNMYCPTNFK